jgi:hypothetical protein
LSDEGLGHTLGELTTGFDRTLDVTVAHDDVAVDLKGVVLGRGMLA